MTDLEKILQQYGNDRRQQQKVSETLHGMARRQRRRVLMACTVLLLTTTVWSILKMTSTHQDDAVIVAQQEKPATTQYYGEEPTTQSPSLLSHPDKKRPTPTTANSLQDTNSQQNDTTIHHYEPLPSSIATYQQPDSDDIRQTEIKYPQDSHQPVIQPFDNNEIILADNHVTIPSDNEENRFHFTASIGASALPKIGNGTVHQDNYSSFNYDLNSHTSFSPNVTLAANVGVGYAIPLGDKHGFEVGIGLSGYSHQGEITTYSIESTTSIHDNGIDGGGTETSYYVSHNEAFNTFSLYASLPLTFILKKQKANDLGWNMSITPSHSLVFSRTFGNKSILNPWRLTMGLGLTFHRGLVRRVSVTANLLPLYTSSNLHELGLEIGF